jgi:3-hydroxymyristoyl/3-hydroxydecanoyl-(acyl carrier protein) dehydratase
MPGAESTTSINASIQEILPHRPPFIFVDEARRLGMESLEAAKRIKAEEFKFYRPDKTQGEYCYPREILVEHAAQTMMVLGHHYGRDIGWLPESYKSIGLLTTIEDFVFHDIEIRPGDEVRTRVDVELEKRALYYIKVGVSIRLGDARAAEGSMCGVFLTGQYDDLYGRLPPFRTKPGASDEHPHFSFIDPEAPVHFASSYWFLQGHFPGSPCIPGCMFLRGVNELADPSKRIRRIVRAKFKKIAIPHKRYRYDLRREGDLVQFSVLESESGELHAKGTLELG